CYLSQIADQRIHLERCTIDQLQIVLEVIVWIGRSFDFLNHQVGTQNERIDRIFEIVRDDRHHIFSGSQGFPVGLIRSQQTRTASKNKQYRDNDTHDQEE